MNNLTILAALVLALAGCDPPVECKSGSHPDYQCSSDGDGCGFPPRDGTCSVCRWVCVSDTPKGHPEATACR